MKPAGTQLVAEFINCSENVLNNKISLENIVKKGIRESGMKLRKIVSYKFNPMGITTIAIISESHIAIHTYPEARHASIDIFTCSVDRKKHEKLIKYLRKRLKPKTVRTMELIRGNPLDIKSRDWITEHSVNGFDVRYQINKMLVSKKSRYQHIEIIENSDFGRMLFLDKELQIAEKDAHIYNREIVRPLVENKKLEKVAILGGGDGGVLYEILKYNPKKVFLVDIDEEVINLSKKYLKSICKNSFENKNVSVIIEDANEFLTKNRGFDGIVYDLTNHPESITNITTERFLRKILSLARKSLKKGGVISVQCCDENDKETIKLIKNILSRHYKNIRFSKVFIPSFCEVWVFASAVAK